MFNNNPRKGVNWFFVLVYLIGGIYFLNYPFNFISVPESISNFQEWIIFVAGIFMVLGALNSIKLGRRIM